MRAGCPSRCCRPQETVVAHAILSHARPHRHRTRAQGQAVGGLQHRLARVEPGREERRARPGDARVLSGALPAGRGSRRDGTRVRRRRALWRSWRTRSEPARPTSGASPSRPLRPSRPMGEAEFERAITLLRACWAFFDGVAARVSPEMRKGPRGGGRDRDRIIRHTIRTERGLREAGRVADPGGRGAYPGWTAAASGGLRRGDARLQRRGGRAAHAVVDAAIPHPTLCLPHARPCVGDGGQGPLRPGRGLTHHSSVRRSGPPRGMRQSGRQSEDASGDSHATSVQAILGGYRWAKCRTHEWCPIDHALTAERMVWLGRDRLVVRP